MQRKQVIFVADSLDNAHKFQQVLSSLDVDVAAGSSAQFKKLLGRHPACDLVVYEARGGASEDVAGIEALLLEDGTASLLVIVGEGQLARFRLPVQVKSDFVMRNASPEECAARIRQLLWPGNEAAVSDCLVVENMTVNLATYQVTVAGEPLDLTYLEYALLAFLVTHPSRTYSRDALLRRVWGFDYYGGSRTVDVHVSPRPRQARPRTGSAPGNRPRRRLPLERIGRAVRHPPKPPNKNLLHQGSMRALPPRRSSPPGAAAARTMLSRRCRQLRGFARCPPSEFPLRGLAPLRFAAPHPSSQTAQWAVCASRTVERLGIVRSPGADNVTCAILIPRKHHPTEDSPCRRRSPSSTATRLCTAPTMPCPKP